MPDDIYDQYNGGVKSPGAIRDFLVDAYASGLPKPVYVALVGDASANPDKLTDYLPAHYDPVPYDSNNTVEDQIGPGALLFAYSSQWRL